MTMNSFSLAISNRWCHGKDRFLEIFSAKVHRQTLISISSLAGTGLISIVLQFIGGIIQGRFIGPEALGYYNKFTIIPGYLIFLNLGVFTSLARQYPYYIGKGDQKTALSFAANALGWTQFLCVIQAVIFLLPCAWTAIRGDWLAALGWGTQSILAPVSVYMLYLASTYRNNSDFVAWSKSSLTSSIASLLFLPLVAVYHFVGMCARYSLPALLAMLYAHWKRPLKIRSKFNLGIIKEMIAFGAPLMVFGYINSNLWDAIQRSYILRAMGEKSLGIFIFAGVLSVSLTTVATSISQVFHPRIATLYGSSGRNMTTTFKYSLKCGLAGLVVMLPLVGLMYWLVDPFVRYLLPKYIECIPIARRLCWLSLIPVIDLPGQLLIIAKRPFPFGVSVLTGFTVFVIFFVAITLTTNKVILETIAIILVLGKFTSAIIFNFLAWRLSRLESHS